MSIVRNLFFLITATIFGLVSTLLCVYNYNPFQSDKAVFINFYTSLAVGLGGLFAILIYAVRSRRSKSQSTGIYFWSSTRQGLIISLAISTILLLKGLKILDYLVGGSVVVVLILIELFFQTKKQSKAEI